MRHTIAMGFLVLASTAASVGVGCGSDNGNTFDESDIKGGASGSSGDGLGGIGTSGGTRGDGGGSSGGGTSGGPACATAKGEASRQPVYLSIVLDGSGSMDGAIDGDHFAPNSREPDPLAPDRTFKVCNNRRSHDGNDNDCPNNIGLSGKKWIAARGALKAYFDAEAVNASPMLGVGLRLFESSRGTVNENVGLLDAAHAGRLWNVIRPNGDDTWPEGSTPLRSHMQNRVDYLRGFTPEAPLAEGGRKALLVITDGVPNGDGETPEQNVLDLADRALADDGIATAVIGVGDPAAAANVYNASFLSELASRGGVAPVGCDPAWNKDSPASSKPCHLQVTPGEKPASALQAEIKAAIDAIAGSLVSCTFTLDKSSEIDPAKVNVVYISGAGGESQVAQDAANGWSYDDPADPGAVILHGQACDTLKADPNGRIDIVIGCPTGTGVVVN